jgi:hypothetical protein
MSSKQIAYAAVHGRKVTFKFLAPDHEIVGYVCGQDDYHWLVATTTWEGIGSDPSINTLLVHKSSADIITLSPDSTLEDEVPAVRVAIENVGRGFWSFCERTYLGGKGSDDPDAAVAASISPATSTPSEEQAS